MPWLFINTFHGGINTDNARIKRNQALKMENLDISKNGLMKKRLGYTDLALGNTPATINTIFEWSNSVADDQLMLAEKTSSDISNLWQSADAVSFVILRQLGNYAERNVGNVLPYPGDGPSNADWTFSASSGSDGAFHASLGISLGTTDDIYNGWILHSLQRKKSILITDYIGASMVFFLNSAATGAGAMASQEFYITKSQWDKVHVYSENRGVLRGGTGNASQNTPFWLGYINGASFYNGEYSITDYVLMENVMLLPPDVAGFERPWSPMDIDAVVTSANVTSNFLATGIYYLRFSMVMDNAQESHLSSTGTLALTISDGDSIKISFDSITPINPRVSQVKIYRSDASDGVYNFVDTVSLNQAAWERAGGSAPSIYSLSFLISAGNAAAGDSYADITGRSGALHTGLINYNYKYETQILNRRFIANVSETRWVSPAPFNDIGHKTEVRQYKNRVYWSHITPKLVICPDIFLENNFMVFGEGGSDEITGIIRILNQLIVFLEGTTFVVNMSSGNVLTWEKSETISGIGCIAPDSLVDAGGRILFAGTDNIYLFDLNFPVPLLDDKFEEDYQAISVATKKTGKAVYYPKRRQYKITFSETETAINAGANMYITYVIDLRTGAVHKHHSARNTLSFAVGIDGELFRTDGAIIMSDDNSSMTETIGIGYRSSMIDAGVPEDKRWKTMLLHYQSDDEIKIKIYLRRKDEGRFGTAVKTLTFPAKPGSMTTKTIEINEQAEALQFEVYSTDSSNTTIKIGQIGLEYEQLERTNT